MSLTTDYKSYFDSELYLKTVYDEEKIGEFTAVLLQWFHEAFSSGGIKGKQLLDVGTGPTIHSVISASPHVEEIYLSDYTPSNLDILRSWWKGERKYLKAVFEYVLSLENKGQTMVERNDIIRSKVKAIVPIDITLEDPLQIGTKNIVPATYDIVISSFTVEAASPSEKLKKSFESGQRRRIYSSYWINRIVLGLTCFQKHIRLLMSCLS